MKLLRTVFAAATASLPLIGSAAGLPADARIRYEVNYSGVPFTVGRAEQHWHAEGGRYELQTDLVPLIGPRIRYVSKGRMTAQGLVPDSFAEYRGSETTPRVRAEFDWVQRELRYGPAGEPHTAPLQPGAQDVNVLAFQLAWLGESAAGSLQVTTGKKLATYSFAGGPRRTVTINGQPTPAQPWRSGSGKGRTEVWVAPQFANLPVRVIRAEDDKELELAAQTVEFKPAP